MKKVTAMFNGDAVITSIEDCDELTDGLKWEDENGFFADVMSLDDLEHIQYYAAEV
jgi:hypothetical protein